ncbi:TonB family protein [Pseudomonas sp. NPDC089554]|uniref:energy transducer TonB n=1 Tax=Pseudomonas sp. NPDC089554 TaxID=3390653 RepID=UPI003CFE1863
MSHLPLEMSAASLAWPAWREHGFAFGVALALHAGLAYVLLNLSHQAPMPTPVSAVITTQLVTLPAPVVQPPAPVAAEPPAAPAPAPVPEPVVEAPPVEQAELAFKRVEQERKEKARQVERERQLRREETLRQERLAREEQERQALKEQQLAQARQAEVDRLAARNAQAAAAQAQADSRQYLPIAKQAPDYPARALERKIEGECTVAYTVNAVGRVEDPKVVGDCHPMFVKPSLAAAKTFRYQPRVVNGQAVAVANVKNTFSYKIQ